MGPVMNGLFGINPASMILNLPVLPGDDLADPLNELSWADVSVGGHGFFPVRGVAIASILLAYSPTMFIPLINLTKACFAGTVNYMEQAGRLASSLIPAWEESFKSLTPGLMPTAYFQAYAFFDWLCANRPSLQRLWTYNKVAQRFECDPADAVIAPVPGNDMVRDELGLVCEGSVGSWQDQPGALLLRHMGVTPAGGPVNAVANDLERQLVWSKTPVLLDTCGFNLRRRQEAGTGAVALPITVDDIIAPADYLNPGAGTTSGNVVDRGGDQAEAGPQKDGAAPTHLGDAQKQPLPSIDAGGAPKPIEPTAPGADQQR